MPLAAVGIVVPCLAGIVCLLPLLGRRNLLLVAALAFGLATGLSSCLAFGALVVTGALGRTYVWTEILLSIAACGAGLALGRRRPATLHAPDSIAPKLGLVAVGFGVCLLASLTLFALLSLREPSGGVDALSIWNLRARFLHRSGGEWPMSFSPLVPKADYPLLLPLTQVRGWLYLGHESAVVPAVTALSFVLATAALLIGAVSALRDARLGLIAGILLLAEPGIVAKGAAQIADVPLSFFVLATIVLWALGDDASANERRALAGLAGLMAALAAWTKNEGLLFAVCALVVSVGRAARSKVAARDAAWFVLGALPALGALAYFKGLLAPPNDLFAGRSLAAVLARLTDLSRAVVVAKSFALEALVPGALLVVTSVVLGARGGSRIVRPLAVLALVGLGYFAVFLTSPYDVAWHLRTSLPRLLLHLWPSAVFLVFVAIRDRSSEGARPAR